MLGKEESVRSIRKTGQRLQTKPILSKPSQEDVKRRMEAVESHWQRIKLAVPRRRKNIDDKLSDLKKFTENLEELYIWTSTTKDLLDTQASLGKISDDHRNVEVSFELEIVSDNGISYLVYNNNNSNNNNNNNSSSESKNNINSSNSNNNSSSSKNNNSSSNKSNRKTATKQEQNLLYLLSTSYIQEIKRNLATRRPVYDEVNNTYDKYQEESILSTTAIPSSTHDKWRKMNADWGTISRHVDQPRMIVEQPISFTGTQVVCTTPDILITHADDGTVNFDLLFLCYYIKLS